MINQPDYGGTDNLSQNLQVLDPVESWYHSAETAPVSKTKSFFLNLSEGAISGLVGMAAALKLVNPEEAKSYQVFKETLEKEATSPNQSIFQQSGNHVANFLGSILNPISLITGEIGGIALGGVSRYLPSILPDAISEFAAKPISEFVGEKADRFIPKIGEGTIRRTSTLGDIGAKKMKAFGIGAGIVLPQELEENFDTKNNTINYSGAVKGTMAGGGIALALDTIPYLYGVIRGKYKNITGKDINTESSEVIDKTLDELKSKGLFAPEEVEWYKQHKENPNNEKDLSSKAADILLSKGHNVDTGVKKVLHDLLKPEDIKNLNSSIIDEVTSNLSNDKQAVTDFILGNRMDEIKNNIFSLDGIQGVIDSLTEKLTAKESSVKSISDLVSKLITKNSGRLKQISEENIYKRILKKGLEEHEVPVVVPENVSERIRSYKEIKRLETLTDNLMSLMNKVPKSSKNRFQKRIELNNNKIKSLKEKQIPFKDVNTELQYLHDNLIRDGKVKDNFQHSSNYHRLLDFAKFESGARALLYKVSTLAEYQKQESYKDVLEFFQNVMKSNFNNIADPKKVINYLKNRLENNLPTELKNQVSLKEVEKNIKEIPMEMDKSLDETRNMLREKGASSELIKEFDQAAAKAKEFKSSTNILKNLISCVLGGFNG